ncbi:MULTISPECIES: nucleoside triphosphate pyrophosphatase [Arthrospira]|jgi:septum formation protein|uniref:Nucleoside triphosphate pyrophosphatase n=1 Tax=Limnospira platensis NIES-46 TaxID=1236695 RepID=A0A5M3TB05_LIMPL|nr:MULTISPECIES: nucleoside triphosphate pyrophosphatase [Arthrospira]AMW28411.1 septum formation protein Maf [Arthrospira platensis YZ]KDR58000.1 septum formation protein Maf [Arthrospira platensis str. Paraca]MBD2670284.1 septum formation inhibitor Maf [Arthrospira platensis FACHB-439]MBD2710796.1 septum formation inhibitor Maf [Arthrospira platensis FACHB-835]MDF2209605.1 Maf family protein [Arthrospira platensis NCB002]MDT9183252.1 Maf family protein [Limnospira sp. PMC 289.06]MDT9294163
MADSAITFVLASASPARYRLLKTVGIDPVVIKSDFDESSIQIDDPTALVEQLAQAKAEAVGRRLKDHPPSYLDNGKNALILGCDSVLVMGGEIYGKPADKAEAIARWQNLSGHVGQLYTGHALLDLNKPKLLVLSRITDVHFATVDEEEIRSYVETGEPLNCAGCFAIEGKGGAFVDRLDGCHTNVIGLSLPLLRLMLRELGYGITNFWN